MAADVELRPFFLEDVSDLGHIMSWITSDVGHVHMHVLDFEEQFPRILHPDDVVVDVAVDSAERLECFKLLRGLNVSYVAGMPYLVHVLEKVKDLRNQTSMSVRYYADAKQKAVNS